MCSKRKSKKKLPQKVGQTSAFAVLRTDPAIPMFCSLASNTFCLIDQKDVDRSELIKIFVKP